MKIVMTLSNPYPPDDRVYKEAKSLVNAGHEVVVLAWDREGKYPKEETADGIKIMRFGPCSHYGSFFDFSLKLPLFYLKALRFLLRENFDAVHTHDFDTAFLGFIVKYLKKKRWVYDVHDLYYTFFEVEGNLSFLSWLISEIVRRIDVLFAKHSDHLIVATQSIGGKYEGLREYYIRKGIPPEKITTIWNVPILEEFAGHKRTSKKYEKFVIGFIGTIRTISNFVPLFEAVKNLNFPVKLLFVGGGKSIDELKRLVEKEYPELDVEFVGSVPYQEVPRYYRMCNVIYSLYPTRENIKRAIAIKVFEAVSVGVPVMVNRNTLMEDFVNEYRCGVIFNGASIEELKRCLVKVKEIRFNSRLIRKKWNWKNEEYKLVRVYEVVNNL